MSGRFLVLACLVACSKDSGSGPADSATVDAPPADATRPDAAPADAVLADAPPPDAVLADAAIVTYCDHPYRVTCVGDACTTEVCPAYCLPDGCTDDGCAAAREEGGHLGCDFFAVDLDNAVVAGQGSAAAQPFALLVANPGPLAAAVTVVNATETVAEIAVPAASSATIPLPSSEVDGSTDPALNDGSGSALGARAYRLTSTEPVAVYQHNPLGVGVVFSNDASLLLPVSALGTEHTVGGWPQTLAVTADPNTNGSIDLRAFVTVVATAPGTVTVTPSVDFLEVPAGPPLVPGVSATFTVQAFDVLNLETDGFLADPTGTVVGATVPIAVFAGSEASDAPLFATWPERECCADHLEEQLPPSMMWGRRFVAPHAPSRTGALAASGFAITPRPEPEVFRVVAGDVAAAVETSIGSYSLSPREHVDLQIDADLVVSATAPVLVLAVEVGQQAVGIPSMTPGGQPVPGGDPSMVVITPAERYRRRHAFATPDTYIYDFFVVTGPSDATWTVDGAPPSACTREDVGTLDVDGADRPVSVWRCQLSFPIVDGTGALTPGTQGDGYHVVDSDRPVAVFVHGFDRYVSHAHPAGFGPAVRPPWR